jgi:heme exporter protein D
MSHWTFIAMAYGFTVVCIVAELLALMRRRRQALELAAIEQDLDEYEREAA